MKVLNAKFAILFAAIVFSFGLMSCSSDGGNNAIVPEEEESSKLIPLKISFGAANSEEGSRSIFKETAGINSLFWWMPEDKLTVVIGSHNGQNAFYGVNFEALPFKSYGDPNDYKEYENQNKEYAKFSGSAFVSQTSHLSNGNAFVAFWYLPSYTINKTIVERQGEKPCEAYKDMYATFATVSLADQTAVNNSEALGKYAHSYANLYLKGQKVFSGNDKQGYSLNYDEPICMQKIFSYAHFKMKNLPEGSTIKSIGVYGTGVYKNVEIKHTYDGSGSNMTLSYTPVGQEGSIATEAAPIYVNPKVDFYMALFPGTMTLNFKVTLDNNDVYSGSLRSATLVAGKFYRGKSSGEGSINSTYAVSLTKQ